MNNTPTPLTADVPLIGQPIKVMGYIVMPLVQCTCGIDHPMQLLGQLSEGQWQTLPTMCPKCHNIYRIQAVGVDGRGLLGFSIELSRSVES